MASLQSLRIRVREIERMRGPQGYVQLGYDVDCTAIYGDDVFTPTHDWELIQQDDEIQLYRHKESRRLRARYNHHTSDGELVRRGCDLAFL